MGVLQVDGFSARRRLATRIFFRVHLFVGDARMF
jgi:hypothetical protein